MVRKTLAILAFLVLAAALLSSYDYIRSGHAEKAETGESFDLEGYNVIIITIDALRADHLGCYGYERNTSPNMDAFAGSGLFFEHAYTTRPKTSPAIASMLTGNYDYTHGVQLVSQYLGPQNLLLTEILNDNGYRTGAVLSNHVLYPEFGFTQGFDDFVGAVDWRGELTTSSITWLEENSGEMFFFWVHYLKPHTLYEPAYPYNETFVNDSHYGYERISLSQDSVEYKEGVGGVPEWSILGDNDNLYYYVSQYDGEIAYVDYEVGMLLDAVEELGLFENSIIIITADHGESLGDHNYYFEHGQFAYDACSRIPLIIRLPGTAPATLNAPVSLVDITPTVLDLLGIENTAAIEGHSLAPLMSGAGYPEYVYGRAGYTHDPQASVRKGDWKLVYIPDQYDRSIMNSVEYELYNTREDPEELVNLAGAGLPVYDELKGEMERWIATWHDDEYKEGFNSTVDGSSMKPETIEILKSLGYMD